MRAVISVLTLLLAFAIGGLSSAAVNGTAARGDNCTPFNSYAIGYSVPTEAGSSTIVDHAALLANGWKLIGWAIVTRDGANWFVPYPAYYPGPAKPSPAFIVPPVIRLATADTAGIDTAYATYVKQLGKLYEFSAPPDPAPTIVIRSGCFKDGLPSGA